MYPAQIRVVISEEPPAEKNGSGIPVAGSAPETTATLSKTCEIIIVVKPAAKSLLNNVSALQAALYPINPKTANRIKNNNIPKKPVSSTYELKIKSE